MSELYVMSIVRAQCGHHVAVSGRPGPDRQIEHCPDCIAELLARRGPMRHNQQVARAESLLTDDSRNPDLVLTT